MEQLLQQNFEKYDGDIAQLKGSIEVLNRQMSDKYQSTLSNYGSTPLAPKNQQSSFVWADSQKDVVFDSISLTNVNLYRSFLYFQELQVVVGAGTIVANQAVYLHPNLSPFYSAFCQVNGTELLNQSYLSQASYQLNDTLWVEQEARDMGDSEEFWGQRQRLSHSQVATGTLGIQAQSQNRFVQGIQIIVPPTAAGGPPQNVDNQTQYLLKAVSENRKMSQKLFQCSSASQSTGAIAAGQVIARFTNVKIPLWKIFLGCSIFSLDEDVNINQLSIKFTLQACNQFMSICTSNTQANLPTAQIPLGLMTGCTSNTAYLQAGPTSQCYILFACNQGVPPSISQKQMLVPYVQTIFQSSQTLTLPIIQSYKYVQQILLSMFASGVAGSYNSFRQDISPVGIFARNGNNSCYQDSDLADPNSAAYTINNFLLNTSQIQYLNQIGFSSFQFSNLYLNNMQKKTGVSLNTYLLNNNTIMLDYTQNSSLGLDVRSMVSSLVFTFTPNAAQNNFSFTTTFAQIRYLREMFYSNGLFSYEMV